MNEGKCAVSIEFDWVVEMEEKGVTHGLLIYSSHVTYVKYGKATVPTQMAMYVEARLAHWLYGSASLLTCLTLTNIAAPRPRAAAEKARTVSRNTRGTKGFLRSNLWRMGR